MTAYEFICSINHVPMINNFDKPLIASKGARRRWLENKSIRINGVTPMPNDEISFPIKELIFFPNSKNRCTMISYEV